MKPFVLVDLQPIFSSNIEILTKVYKNSFHLTRKYFSVKMNHLFMNRKDDIFPCKKECRICILMLKSLKDALVLIILTKRENIPKIAVFLTTCAKFA